MAYVPSHFASEFQPSGGPTTRALRQVFRIPVVEGVLRGYTLPSKLFPFSLWIRSNMVSSMVYYRGIMHE